MKPPTQPFWVHANISGEEKWHLCIIRGYEKEPMIYYIQEDFEDYWYDDDWDEEDIHPVEEPEL